MAALLQARNLRAFYAQAEVLHGIDFALNEGGITTILGANGAGKTTTLRAVCGMVRTQGEISFDARRIDGKRTEEIARGGIAHVPDGRGTFLQLTTEENLRLGAHSRRDRAGVARDLALVYDYFPRLKERMRQQAGTLSGGEQQMLAISRALMLRPKLLLLDEPSFGLAPLVVQEIFRILRHHQSATRDEHVAGRAERHARARPCGSCLSAGSRPRRDVGPPRATSRRIPPSVAPTLVTRGYPRMETFMHQVLSGLATGGIYASIALALVMIYQATNLVNFAQGEMAMFSTYIAWSLIEGGLPYWGAFAATVAIALHHRRRHRAGDHPPDRAQVGARGRRRLHRAPGDLQQRGRLDLDAQPQDLPEPVFCGRYSRQQIPFGARNRSDADHAGRVGRALRVLPLYAARSRHAGRRLQSGVEPARRYPGRLDAGARMGSGRRHRRHRRNDGRSRHLSRSQHDDRHPALRVRRRFARWDRQSGRRRDRWFHRGRG